MLWWIRTSTNLWCLTLNGYFKCISFLYSDCLCETSKKSPESAPSPQSLYFHKLSRFKTLIFLSKTSTVWFHLTNVCRSRIFGKSRSFMTSNDEHITSWRGGFDDENFMSNESDFLKNCWGWYWDDKFSCLTQFESLKIPGLKKKFIKNTKTWIKT